MRELGLTVESGLSRVSCWLAGKPYGGYLSTSLHICFPKIYDHVSADHFTKSLFHPLRLQLANETERTTGCSDLNRMLGKLSSGTSR